MFSKQKVFEACKNLYGQSFGIVKEMAKAIAQYYEETQGNEFDPGITEIKFELLMQHSLLQVASADFELHADELIFIRDLAIKFDWVDFYNSLEKTDLTWEEIYHMSVTDFRRKLKSSEKAINAMADEVVNVFAICDAVLEDHDLVAELEKNVELIIKGVASMDGSFSDVELNAPTLIEDVIRRIKKQKKELGAKGK